MPYYIRVFEFIETHFFTGAVLHYLTDDEYAKLQGYMNAHPETGAVVPGSGGVRKLRWGMTGRGSAAGCESSTTCAESRARSGCLRSMERTRKRTFPRTCSGR